MAYEVTAIRKRPQTFDQLVGQEFVVATLKSSISSSRVAHAYLFSGPRGVGKTSAARIMAKALNCESGPTDTPCGECAMCREIARGSSLDVIEIDGASNTSVNDVRELKDEVLFAPSSGRYKVYIIDEVHMLSNSAFNALLKTIEEPPPYIVFIFATTQIHKVPATIRSRCQQFNFRLIGIGDIKANLAEVAEETGLEADEDALLWIARESTGSLRDAQTLFDQVMSFSGRHITYAVIKEKLNIVGLDELNEMLRRLASGENKAVLELTDEILARGVAVEQLVIDLAGMFRNILFLRNGIRAESIIGFSAKSFDEQLLAAFEPVQIEKAIELLLELYRKLRFSLNQRFELELVMSRLARLRELITGAELLSRIESLRAEMRSSGGAHATEMAMTVGVDTGARPESQQDGQSGEKLADELDVGQKLIDSLRREKPALATALEKAQKWSVDQKTCRIDYAAGDRFLVDMVSSERQLILEKLTELLGRAVQIKIELVSASDSVDPTRERLESQVKMVRKVFKGEVVQGE